MKFETMIFCAGQGNRLEELGKHISKVLLPVWFNKCSLEPLLLRIIRQALNANTSKIYLVVNYLQDQIIHLIDNNRKEINVPIEFIHQVDLNGEAGGLFYLKNQKFPLLAIDGDNYLLDDFYFKDLVNFYFSNPCIAAIGIKKVPDIQRYANVKIDDQSNSLIDIVEKPDLGTEFGNLAKMGCYMLSPELLSKGPGYFKDSKGELATTAAFSNCCRDHIKVLCLEYLDDYIDIGTFKTYVSHLISSQ